MSASRAVGLELYVSLITTKPCLKRTTSPRLSAGCSFGKTRAASSAPIPHTLAAASAATAFITLWRPISGSLSCATPAGAMNSNVVPSIPWSSIFSARNCAFALLPKVITRPGATSPKRATRSSSAFSTEAAASPAKPCPSSETRAPRRGKFSINSRSANATSSIELKNSRCSTVTRVTTPTSGATMRVSRASSPRRDMPSSATTASCSSSSWNSVSGNP